MHEVPIPLPFSFFLVLGFGFTIACFAQRQAKLGFIGVGTLAC